MLAAGMPARPLRPADLDQIRAIGMRELMEATARAFCVPTRVGRGPRAPAQRALILLAIAARIPCADVCYHTGLTRSAVSRVRHAHVPEIDLDAVRLQVSLRDAMRAVPAPS